jgi:lipoprotein signal peptidase
MTVNNILLWIATIVSIVAFSFWRYLWESAFYHIDALFITILCTVIFLQNRTLFVSFFLICASIGNLIDEIYYNNTTTTENEIYFAIIISVFWYIKNLDNARKIPTK